MTPQTVHIEPHQWTTIRPWWAPKHHWRVWVATGSRVHAVRSGTAWTRRRATIATQRAVTQLRKEWA